MSGQITLTAKDINGYGCTDTQGRKWDLLEMGGDRTIACTECGANVRRAYTCIRGRKYARVCLEHVSVTLPIMAGGSESGGNRCESCCRAPSVDSGLCMECAAAMYLTFAAPDLLEALEQMVTVFHYGNWDALAATLPQAYAAIGKAKGA